MNQIATGIYRWTAPHPDWKPGSSWDELVSSYAIDDGTHLVIVDPLTPPPELGALVGSREVIVFVTCNWHRRDAAALAEQLDAALFCPPVDEEHPDPLPGDAYQAGDELPAGIKAFAGLEPTDLVLWIGSVGAVVAGDTLIERDGTLIVPIDWSDDESVSLETVAASLKPLLDLPVQIVLPTHGAPHSSEELRALLA